MIRKGQKSAYYPIFLNIGGKKCVVIGGGQVALRKVKMLLEHGADNVEVISPNLTDELVQLVRDGEIRALNREYRTGDLKDACLAIAATDSRQINQQVVTEAQKKRVLVNVVDDAQNSDFIFPSYLRRGEITVAVSTSGKSPALARKIRSRLEKDFGDEYAALALLVNEVRAEVKHQGIKVDGDAWQEALDVDLLIDLLRKGDNEKARAILTGHLQKNGKVTGVN